MGNPTPSSGSGSNTPWYYTFQGQRHGPVSPEKLKLLVEQGVVTSQTLVWRKGLEDWVQASRVAGLFSDLGAPPRQHDLADVPVVPRSHIAHRRARGARRHTRLGIASLIAFGAGVLGIMVFGRWSNSINWQDPCLYYSPAFQSEYGRMSLVFWGICLTSLLGLAVGIAGICRANKRKVFAIVGTILNLPVFALMSFIVLDSFANPDAPMYQPIMEAPEGYVESPGVDQLRQLARDHDYAREFARVEATSDRHIEALYRCLRLQEVTSNLTWNHRLDEVLSSEDLRILLVLEFWHYYVPQAMYCGDYELMWSAQPWLEDQDTLPIQQRLLMNPPIEYEQAVTFVQKRVPEDRNPYTMPRGDTTGNPYVGGVGSPFG
jgi:hypothetical protein